MTSCKVGPSTTSSGLTARAQSTNRALTAFFCAKGSVLKTWALKISFLLSVVVVAGCSVESKSESCTYNGRPVACSQMPGGAGSTDANPAPEQRHESVDFACDYKTCHSGSEYCLLSVVTSNGFVATKSCETFSPSCHDCDCLPADAKSKFPTASNCNGFITCSAENGRITVTCQIPRT